MTTDQDKVETFVLDIPEDVQAEDLAVSHALQLGALKIRVLTEPHAWKILQSGNDPIKLVEAYCHPLDWGRLDAFLSGRVQMGDGTAEKILTAMLKKPTGHPTVASDASSES